MTLRLILIRHAKSSWDDPAMQDHDRPLNDRGRRSATALGQWLASRGYLPGQVLSSTAARTRETWRRIAEALDAEVPAVWEPNLYHAMPSTYLNVLRGAVADTVVMIGHNPGIAHAAAEFAAAPPPHPRFRDYPTAATTVYDFGATRWGDVDWRQGSVRDFVVPRELGVD